MKSLICWFVVLVAAFLSTPMDAAANPVVPEAPQWSSQIREARAALATYRGDNLREDIVELE